jgi:hypothetical protein
MPTRDEIELRERADRALRRGRPSEALGHFRSLLRRVKEMQPGVYEGWLEGFLSSCRPLGREREAAYALIGLRRFAEAERGLDPKLDVVALAACLAKRDARMEGAALLEAAGLPVQAALEREAARDLTGAARLWRGLVSGARLRERRYEGALAWFNLGRVSRRLGDAAGARRAFGEAQDRLEEVCDAFEAQGLLDRAYEGHTVLVALGRETGAFENLAEGYVNAIRLLGKQEARFRVQILQLHEELIAAADAAGELVTATRLAEECASFCAQQELVYERHYLERVVVLGRRAGREGAAPVALVENALAMAFEAAASLGDITTCAAICGELAALPLAAGAKARYAALAARFDKDSPWRPAPPSPGLPEALRRRPAVAEIWIDDLVEWELDGEPAPVLARVAVGRADFLARAALRALLLTLDPAGRLDETGGASDLALALGEAMVYEVLRPLERLYERPDGRIRASVMTALGRLYFRRTFGLLRLGLHDPEPAVRHAAQGALGAMVFPQAVDLQARLFHESADEAVRMVALEAIADAGTLEAGLFLVDLVRSSPVQVVVDRAAARLGRLASPEIVPILRHHAARELGPRRAIFERLVQGWIAQG